MSYPPQAAAPAAPAAAEPAGPPSGSKPQDTYNLHSCALKAQTALERLATELAHGGAPRQVTTTVTKMADAVRQIVNHTGGKPPAEAAAPAPQKQSMSSAANSLVADVAARKAQQGGQ